MAKTKEELNQIKEEYKALATKLNELSNDELAEITGGKDIWDISVKLKEKFKIVSLGSKHGDEFMARNAHGKNGKPTLTLWDEASSGLINDHEDYR